VFLISTYFRSHQNRLPFWFFHSYLVLIYGNLITLKPLFLQTPFWTERAAVSSLSSTVLSSFLDWEGCYWVFSSILQTIASDKLRHPRSEDWPWLHCFFVSWSKVITELKLCFEAATKSKGNDSDLMCMIFEIIFKSGWWLAHRHLVLLIRKILYIALPKAGNIIGTKDFC